MKNQINSLVAFIIGSPRSGTTILEDILNAHPAIASWYEPYYLWERFFPCPENDIWDKGNLNEKASRKIQKEFHLFGKMSGRPIVLDKLPTHSFNVDIIRRVFPDAIWIHILRDGRDVTLSIRREWKKREEIVQKRDFRGLIRVTLNMMRRQPFWRYRLMAMAYELRSNLALNPMKYLNKSRWKGQVGWGPRFDGWQTYLQNHSTLEFNAMQWVKSVEAVRRSWQGLPESNKIEIRYEELLTQPRNTLGRVLDVLGVDGGEHFFSRIPLLKKDNFHKWEKRFSPYEIEEIRPILDPLLNDLGYANRDRW